MSASPVRLSFAELAGLLAAIFRANSCSDEVAQILAENCAAAERDGALSHGIFRIPGYLGSLRSGWVDGRATPKLEDVGPAFLRVDAGRGFAQPALAAAREALTAKARANGVALLAIRNSHHFGALWPDVEPFAREGLVALMMVNSYAWVVPHGGRKPVYGTNPIAFAAPRAGGEPLVFDQATSALANGDLQIAAREKRAVPEGSGLDREGRPTTDPRAILEGGALLPFGGYKGSAIAMMVEIMGAALTGGNFSFEVDWSAYPGAATPWTGQVLILIDPERGAVRPFAERVEVLVQRLRDAGQDRLPADRRYANRRRAEAEGIPIGQEDYERLVKLAKGGA